MIFTKDLPIDPNYPNSCVYWIYHEDNHTDIKTQGYVGVASKGFDIRFLSHLSDAKHGSNLTVHKAMRKYKDKIKVKEILKAEPEFCLLAEGLFRPKAGIKGTWNIQAGGVGRLDRNLEILSDETRARLSDSAKKRLANPWLHPLAKSYVWILAKEIYSIIVDRSLNCPSVERELNLPYKSCISIVKKIKLGWNPFNDITYNDWLNKEGNLNAKT